MSKAKSSKPRRKYQARPEPEPVDLGPLYARIQQLHDDIRTMTADILKLNRRRDRATRQLAEVEYQIEEAAQASGCPSVALPAEEALPPAQPV